ncbi:MAG TPA: hypothetical protein VK171_16445 [Fimbriimonas sp.]|nr:hypothetical protein [Fimbriimonas sp.]
MSTFWMTIGGVLASTGASAGWWYSRHTVRSKVDADRLSEQSMSLREGFVVTTFAVQLQISGQAAAPVWAALKELAEKHGLHPIGGVDNVFMGVENTRRLAHASVGAVTEFSREAVQLFRDSDSALSPSHEPKVCIHCDTVPMIGLGSTVVLSDLWAETLAMLDRTEPWCVAFSPDALHWAEVNVGAEVRMIQLSKNTALLAA